MTVMLTLGRSEAIFDDDAFPGVPDDVPGSVVHLGPFDYVGLIYDCLRVSENNGDSTTIGWYKDGLWWIEGDEYPFSDVDIYTVHRPVDQEGEGT